MKSTIAERVATLEAVVPGIHEQLKQMNETMTNMDHVIRGNGSPGLRDQVAVIATKVELVEAGRNRWRDAVFTIGGGILVGLVVFLFSDTWSHHATASLPTLQAKP